MEFLRIVATKSACLYTAAKITSSKCACTHLNKWIAILSTKLLSTLVSFKYIYIYNFANNMRHA